MRILAVMVRYKMELAESETARGLCAAFAADPALASAYELLIWDNSPEPLANPRLPIPFAYRHSGRNVGVSGAYNGAMAVAAERGAAWMLLLDQDTTVIAKFLRGMARHAGAMQGELTVAAIAPTVRVGEFTASPRRQLRFNRSRPYPAGEVGLAFGEAGLCNSGALVRTAALAEIGGFSTDFWLDYSDGYVFHQLFLREKKIWRAADVELEHEMTMLDYDRLMAPSRYRNFCYAETAFYDLYRDGLDNAAQTLRLVVRAVKQRLKFKNPDFSRLTAQQFLYRLCVPKRERIRIWKKQQGRFPLPAVSAPET